MSFTVRVSVFVQLKSPISSIVKTGHSAAGFLNENLNVLILISFPSYSFSDN